MKRAIRHLAWTLIGFGSVNALRFGGPELHRRYTRALMPAIDVLMRDFRRELASQRAHGVSGS